jgi:hypothetical protein
VTPPLKKAAPPQLAMLPLPQLPDLDTTADLTPLPTVATTTMLNAYNILTTKIQHNNPSSCRQQQPPPFQQQQQLSTQQQLVIKKLVATDALTVKETRFN